jgi:A/G-specific adenine glycosylase
MNRGSTSARRPRSNRTREGAEEAVAWLQTHPRLPTELRKAIRKYYGERGRDFPWRRTRDPYKVLVAELLLQKTAAKPVEIVWSIFVERYPTVHALAQASVRDVARLIRPLGLRKRIKALREAARTAVRETGGEIAPDEGFLRSLTGVGAYTAAAVLSFSHGVSTAVVDVNCARVYSRIAGFQPNTLRQGLAFAQVVSRRVITAKTHREVNYGVLDLAAEVCRPRPRCAGCPLARLCQSCLKRHV